MATFSKINKRMVFGKIIGSLDEAQFDYLIMMMMGYGFEEQVVEFLSKHNDDDTPLEMDPEEAAAMDMGTPPERDELAHLKAMFGDDFSHIAGSDDDEEEYDPYDYSSLISM